MKRKLMTWEKFEETFKPLADEWKEYSCGAIDIKYKDMKWYISYKMMEYFEKKIEFEKYENSNNYTHRDLKEGWCWHEFWFESEFEPIEFITEEEMVIE